MPVWQDQFESVLSVVLDLCADPEGRIRDLALRVVREMLKSSADLCLQHINVILPRVLQRHKDDERDVLRSAEETLTVLATAIPVSPLMDLIEPRLFSEDEYAARLACVCVCVCGTTCGRLTSAAVLGRCCSAILLATLKLVTKLIQKMALPALEANLTRMLPGLFNGYKNAAAEVRKAVVFALVELHLRLGDHLRPHLTPLSASQQKLLQIYIKRAEEKIRAKSAEGSTTSVDMV